MFLRRALSVLSALTPLLLVLACTVGDQQEAGPQAAPPTSRLPALHTSPAPATAADEAARSAWSLVGPKSAATAAATRTSPPTTGPALRTATRARSAQQSPTRSPTPSNARSTTAPASHLGRSGAPAATSPGDSVAWVSLTSASIHHPVIPQGLSAGGTVSPPQGQVIWFTGYRRVEPGHLGTAVIAGHVSYRGVPDVFADLHRVQPGDLVRVGYRDGTVMKLPVKRTEIVDKGELQYSATVWGENGSTRRVVLITCDDTYGYRPDGHRAANYVVVAES